MTKKEDQKKFEKTSSPLGPPLPSWTEPDEVHEPQKDTSKPKGENE